jgi:EAL domain-containing protein (putative c-di-GMP-specific phosphodiesterase class I)
MDTVVKECYEWQRQGYDIRVAINVSVVDLASLDLPALVAECLVQHGLDPKHLILEIAESTVMHLAVNTIEILHWLREVGVHLAIEDFGTGSSRRFHTSLRVITEGVENARS